MSSDLQPAPLRSERALTGPQRDIRPSVTFHTQPSQVNRVPGQNRERGKR